MNFLENLCLRTTIDCRNLHTVRRGTISAEPNVVWVRKLVFIKEGDAVPVSMKAFSVGVCISKRYKTIRYISRSILFIMEQFDSDLEQFN